MTTEKLIILTDLGQFTAYRVIRDDLSTTPRIELVEQFATIEGHRRLVDEVTDMAGGFPVKTGSGTINGTAAGERHNIQLEKERRVIKTLSGSINRLVKETGAPVWYLAAGKEINHRIVEGLEADVRARLRKNVGSDLTKIDKGSILSYFA